MEWMHRFALVLFLLVFCGCAGRAASVQGGEAGDEAKLKRAQELYRRHKYTKALELLEGLRYSPSVWADDAHLLAAKIYIAQKQYGLAISELKWLLAQYSHSELAPEASFLLGEAYRLSAPRPELDQTNTEKAIEAYRDFLELYPTSPFADSAQKGIELCLDKLAHKEYLSAKLYYRMHKDSSAVVYIRDLCERYGESAWCLWGRYLEGMILLRRGRTEEAKETLTKLLASDPPPELAEKVKRALKKLR